MLAHTPYVHNYGQLPAELKAMDRQTKEVVFALLQHFRALSPTAVQIIEPIFPRRYVLSTADSHGSNAAAEGADQFVHNGWRHAYIRCEIHRCDTAEARTTDLVPETVSGLVNVAVLFERKGHDLIVAFQEWIERAPLRIYQGRPPAHVEATRALLIETFASSSDAEGTQALGPEWKSLESARKSRTYRRLAWTTLFNGDLENHYALGHYEVGCCPHGDTREKMRTVGVHWLTYVLHGWRRNDWLGHEAACEVAGGVAHTHGLLRHGVRILSQRKSAHPAGAEGAASWHTESSQVLTKVFDFVMAPSFEHNAATCMMVAEGFARVKKNILESNSDGSHVRRRAHMARQEVNARAVIA